MNVLFLVPHLSTGGMPQYVCWMVEELIKRGQNVSVIEFSDIAPIYIVQKNKIKKMIRNNLVTLYGIDEEKKESLFNQINSFNPDIIHLQEFPEIWMPQFIANDIYAKNRKYKIVETSHDSGFSSHDKIYYPDKFAFISNYHPEIYKHLDIPYEIIEYPVVKKDRPNRENGLKFLGLDPSYTHILNVGLFTPRKNQAEILDIAKRFEKEKVQFHFVGNQADNFKEYWEPLLKNKPSNCVIWGERDDVDNFYSCMDLFLFTSKGTKKDRETNPLVLKEALSWQMKVMMYNLPVYCGMYDENEDIIFLNDSFQNNCEKISDFLKYNSNKDLKIKSILQVPTGFIEIPPNGWGAIEEILWQYKKIIENNYNLRVLYEDNEDNEDNEYNRRDKNIINHLHCFNHALEFKEEGIPYILTLHDIHPILNGRSSAMYKAHVEAIDGSVFSIAPSEYVKNYYEKYVVKNIHVLNNGVDVDFFTPSKIKREKGLLCLGVTQIYDINEQDDRKGYLLSLKIAKRMGLPITIAGYSGEDFKKLGQDILDYPLLTLINRNLNKEEVRELYQSHSILMHLSYIETGEPTLTMLEAMACGTPVISSYSSDIEMGGVEKCNRSIYDSEFKISKILDNYDDYSSKARIQSLSFKWDKIVEELFNLYKKYYIL